MRNKNENRSGAPSDAKIFISLAIGFALGATVIGSTYERDEDGAYRRGRADGIQECQKPSKLEKAAKWMSH